MYRTLLCGIITAVLGVALSAIGKDYGFIGLIGILVSLIGISVATYGVLSPIKAMALSLDQTSPQKVINQSDSNFNLPPTILPEPVSSITEPTTKLLEIENTRISK